MLTTYNNNNSEAVETVKSLIKGIDIAMLTTVTSEGLVSRPMKTQEVEFDGDLYFLTMKDTAKYEELQHNNQVNVSYVGSSYVSICGTAEIVDDRQKIKEFWNIAYEKMLNTTSDDPNLILIKVHAKTAEYWDTGNWIKSMLSLVYRLTGNNNERTNVNNIVKLN